MVGVAGRSKGCVTCRQRRVKCDETHPECNRCKKAKRTCGGYVQNNFIDGLPSGIRKAAAANKSTQHLGKGFDVPLRTLNRTSHVWADISRPSPGRILEESDTDDVISQSSKPNSSSYQAYAPVPFGGDDRAFYSSDQSMGLWGNEKPAPSLDLTPFRDNIFLTYTAANILRGVRILRAPQLRDLNSPDAILSLDCLLSISTAYFGLQHHDPSVVRLGMQRYGNALTSLNKALTHPVHSKSGYVLGAVTTMMLYEFLAPTSFTGWIDHTFGLERLLVHRGPEAHMAGTAHEQFISARSSIAYACLAWEKPCMIATPEWKTVPWSLNPENKSMFQRLLDILVDIPALTRPPTRLWNTSNPSTALLSDVFRVNKEFKAKLTALDEWWSVWAEENEHSYWEVPMKCDNLSADCIPTLWNTVYEFRDLILGNEFAVYHALRVTILGISRDIDSLDPDVHLLHLRSMAKQARAAAVEICRSIDFHLHARHRGGGGLLLLFPFRMAWKTLGEVDTPESHWLKSVVTDTEGGISGEWIGGSNVVLGYCEPGNGPDDTKQGSDGGPEFSEPFQNGLDIY